RFAAGTVERPQVAHALAVVEERAGVRAIAVRPDEPANHLVGAVDAKPPGVAAERSQVGRDSILPADGPGVVEAVASVHHHVDYDGIAVVDPLVMRGLARREREERAPPG